MYTVKDRKDSVLRRVLILLGDHFESISVSNIVFQIFTSTLTKSRFQICLLSKGD